MIRCMFPMTHILGAVVLTVTSWYPQQLFVFMGSIFQRSHLWQLALSTKASCLGDRTIVIGHCCCNCRSYRSSYNGKSFHFQLQIKGWTHVVVKFSPIFLMSFSHILVTWGTWKSSFDDSSEIVLCPLDAKCLQAAKRRRRNLCCAPSYPSITIWNTHLHCSSPLEILWSITKEIPVFFLSKPGGLWNLHHTVVEPGTEYLDSFM